MPSIEVSFTYSIADQLHARGVYDNNVLFKGFFGKGDKVVALLLVAATILLTGFAGFRWWTYIFPLLALELWFDIVSLTRLQTYLLCKRNPKLLGPYTLVFDEGGMQIKSGTIDARVTWAHFDRMVETPRVFLLIYGKGLYTVIPRSAFASENDMERFRILARSSSQSGN